MPNVESLLPSEANDFSAKTPEGTLAELKSADPIQHRVEAELKRVAPVKRSVEANNARPTADRDPITAIVGPEMIAESQEKIAELRAQKEDGNSESLAA